MTGIVAVNDFSIFKKAKVAVGEVDRRPIERRVSLAKLSFEIATALQLYASVPMDNKATGINFMDEFAKKHCWQEVGAPREGRVMERGQTQSTTPTDGMIENNLVERTAATRSACVKRQRRRQARIREPVVNRQLAVAVTWTRTKRRWVTSRNRKNRKDEQDSKTRASLEGMCVHVFRAFFAFVAFTRLHSLVCSLIRFAAFHR